MKNLIKLLLFTIMTIDISYAETKYLKCTYYHGSASITLNEDENKITHQYENGDSFISTGFFTPNTISYQKRDQDFTIKFEINRETLQYKFGAESAGISVDNTIGQCEIITLKNKI